MKNIIFRLLVVSCLLVLPVVSTFSEAQEHQISIDDIVFVPNPAWPMIGDIELRKIRNTGNVTFDAVLEIGIEKVGGQREVPAPGNISISPVRPGVPQTRGFRYTFSSGGRYNIIVIPLDMTANGPRLLNTITREVNIVDTPCVTLGDIVFSPNFQSPLAGVIELRKIINTSNTPLNLSLDIDIEKIGGQRGAPVDNITVNQLLTYVSQTKRFPYTFPSGGSYNVIVNPINLRDNASLGAITRTVNIVEPPPPPPDDLTIINLKFSNFDGTRLDTNNLRIGQQYLIGFNLKNNGRQPVSLDEPGKLVQLKVDNRQVDYEFASISLGRVLASGEAETFNAVYTFDKTKYDRTKNIFIIATADPGNNIREANENNNSAMMIVRIVK